MLCVYVCALWHVVSYCDTKFEITVCMSCFFFACITLYVLVAFYDKGLHMVVAVARDLADQR